MVLLGSSRQEQAIRPRQVCDQSVAPLQGSTEAEVRTLSFEQRPGSTRRVVHQPFPNESALGCFESVVMTNTIDDQVDLVGGRRRITRPVKPEVLPSGMPPSGPTVVCENKTISRIALMASTRLLLPEALAPYTKTAGKTVPLGDEAHSISPSLRSESDDDTNDSSCRSRMDKWLVAAKRSNILTLLAMPLESHSLHFKCGICLNAAKMALSLSCVLPPSARRAQASSLRAQFDAMLAPPCR